MVSPSCLSWVDNKKANTRDVPRVTRLFVDHSTVGLFTSKLSQVNYMKKENKVPNRIICALWRLNSSLVCEGSEDCSLGLRQHSVTRRNVLSFHMYFCLCLFLQWCGWMPCCIFLSHRLTFVSEFGFLLFLFLISFSTFILYFLLYCHFSSFFFPFPLK